MRPTSYSRAVEQSIWAAGAIGGAALIIELFVSGSVIVPFYPLWLVAIPAAVVATVYVRYLVSRNLGGLSILLMGSASMMASAMILPIGSLADSKVIWSWLVPATLTPAALPRLRQALGWILGWGLALLILGQVIRADSVSGPWWFVVLRSVVTGVTAAVLVAALRRGAARVDRLASAQSDLAQDSHEQSALVDEVSTLGRFLHNTVINTLQAVTRGVEVDHQQELAKRCQSDIQNLKKARTQSEPAHHVRNRDLRAELTDIARLRGLQLEWTGAPDPTLPSIQRDVVRQIATEALTNSAKHSHSVRAEITIIETQRGLDIVIRDDGVGFAADAAPLRGIKSSILELAKAVDIQVEVRSRPGHGTSVCVLVPVDGAAAIWPNRQAQWLIWANAGLAVIQLVVVASQGSISVPLVIAVAAAYCSGIAALLRARGSRLKMALFAALLAVEAVALIVSEVGYGFCTDSAQGWLGPTAAIPLLLIAALVIRSMWLLVVTWVVTAGVVSVGSAAGILANDCGIPFLAYSSTELLYAVFLGCVLVALRRSVLRAERLVEAEAVHRWEIAQSRARTDLYWRRLNASESICLPLLFEVAAEPGLSQSKAFRHRTRVAEQALRTIAEAPAMSSALNDWLIGVVRAANRKGIELRVVMAMDAVTAMEGEQSQWEAVRAITAATLEGGTPKRHVLIRIHNTTAGTELLVVVTDAEAPRWPTDIGIPYSTFTADGQAVATALLIPSSGLTQL